MKGSLFAFFGGAFITLQGVANSRISQDIGSWQAAMITQLTGFIMAFTILMILRDKKWRNFKQVKPLYLIGGSFGAIVVYSNITAIYHIGVTLTISGLLIAQLCLTFLIDSKGWFGVSKQKMRMPQFIGMGMMITGVIILSF
ncbi:DMT family transporter [Bacillus sp. NEB1478]|uniref:DMT family transporter n=1 Tax=Bacillus sp. NEB1478 TaxID=3073816 RepID=UPI002873E669|nr:DMT family transporter [Bacillus sp. NEB1478]WNB92758.1 DMT family transporter [Bacillus sp. NEB1478]